MQSEFATVAKQLRNGYDIVIPVPNETEAITNPVYWQYGQSIRHNVGIRIARLPFNYKLFKFSNNKVPILIYLLVWKTQAA